MSEGNTVVEIRIDDRMLIELVRDAEAESAANEGHPNLAGKYGSLPWNVVETNLFFGESSGIWSLLEARQGAHRVPLLLCECGEPGCWPLMATIDVGETRVIWRDFGQPHRRNWDYTTLGSFSFDRAQYLAAVEEARSTSA